MSDILSHLDNGVLTLRLNRLFKKNALTKAMYTALTEGLAQASEDETVRVVVISAEGDDFCAGRICHFIRMTASTMTICRCSGS